MRILQAQLKHKTLLSSFHDWKTYGQVLGSHKINCPIQNAKVFENKTKLEVKTLMYNIYLTTRPAALLEAKNV